MAAPVLSREDIEQIAGRVLSIYTEAYVPERHLCYQVNPEELADVLGLEVDYQIPSLDGSILGVTSPDEQYVPVYYDGEECYYYLDGNTILIDARLCASPKTVGRKNYTLAHEIAHQILYKAFPDAYGPARRLMCDYRRTPESRRKVTDWTEWQGRRPRRSSADAKGRGSGRDVPCWTWRAYRHALQEIHTEQI